MPSEEFPSLPDNPRLIRSFYANADFLSLMFLLSFHTSPFPPNVSGFVLWQKPTTMGKVPT